MEKIKQLKTERKKFHDDCKVLKEQLQQLKLAYDEKEAQLSAVESKSSGGGADRSKDAEKVEKLTRALREVSDQIKDYEEVKRGVKVIVESLGLEEVGGLDVSTLSQSVDNSILDWDMLEAVTKLGEAYSKARYMASESPETLVKLTSLEEDLAKRTIELMEEIERKDAVTKRLESAKVKRNSFLYIYYFTYYRISTHGPHTLYSFFN